MANIGLSASSVNVKMTKDKAECVPPQVQPCTASLDVHSHPDDWELILKPLEFLSE